MGPPQFSAGRADIPKQFFLKITGDTIHQISEGAALVSPE
jgi:hypothetical protein